MSREIEFRAWLKDEKKMITKISSIKLDINCIYYDNNQMFSYERASFDDIELMQWTSLKDRNGVKIFEGDIVKITIRDKTTVAQVKWLEKRCKLVFVCGEDWIGLEHFQIRSELEVIGNIYENPELLGEKNEKN